METRLILAALRRHKLTTALLVLQVAFTCAIVTNAAFLIVDRIQQATVPSGVDENALAVVTVDDLDAGNHALGLHQADLAALRRFPGVQSAAIIDHVPFGDGDTGTVACGSLAAGHAAMLAHATVPGCAVVGQYAGGPGSLATLGLKLVAGRDFRADEFVVPKSGESIEALHLPAVIISKALAAQLYPDHPARAVGQVVYYGMGGLMKGQGSRVVGVVAQLHGMAASGEGPGQSSALVPVEQTGERVSFALRSRPSDRARVLMAAVATLAKRSPQREISAADARTYTQIRAAYFSRDTTMINLLLAAALGLLFVTALGIAGLASFWVGQRTRSIGIRRALGATRANILRYFQTENFLIVAAGIVFGVILAVGLNLALMKHYEVAHLPWWYLPGGALALWMLGQIAVLAPALRASKVPPLVATRGAG